MLPETNAFPTTTNPQHEGLPTIACSGLPLRTDILGTLRALFDAACGSHASLAFGAVELHYPRLDSQLPANDLLGAFLTHFVGALRTPAGKTVYAWSREQWPNEPHQRYRLVALVPLDDAAGGPRLESARHVWCGRIWAGADGGLVVPLSEAQPGTPPNSFATIRRDDPDYARVFGECFHLASALAIEPTKRMGHGRCHSFGCSRL